MRDLPSRKTKIFGVISQYGELPMELTAVFKDSAVFINVDDANSNLGSRAKFIDQEPGERPNPGHSLGNFFEWIASNYDSLPDRVAFLKSNIIPRHVANLDALEQLLAKETGIVMLWSDPAFSSSHFQDSKLFQNFYVERNNSWFMAASPERKFSDFDAFMEFVFTDWIRPKWVPFAPGACYVVSRELVEAVPKELFLFLLEVSTYKFFPAESYAVERALWLIFNQCGTFHDRFNSSAWRSEVPREQNFRGGGGGAPKSLFIRTAEALEHIGCRMQHNSRVRSGTLGR